MAVQTKWDQRIHFLFFWQYEVAHYNLAEMRLDSLLLFTMSTLRERLHRLRRQRLGAAQWFVKTGDACSDGWHGWLPTERVVSLHGERSAERQATVCEIRQQLAGFYHQPGGRDGGGVRRQLSYQLDSPVAAGDAGLTARRTRW